MSGSQLVMTQEEYKELVFAIEENDNFVSVAIETKVLDSLKENGLVVYRPFSPRARLWMYVVSPRGIAHVCFYTILFEMQRDGIEYSAELIQKYNDNNR